MQVITMCMCFSVARDAEAAGAHLVKQEDSSKANDPDQFLQKTAKVVSHKSHPNNAIRRIDFFFCYPKSSNFSINLSLQPFAFSLHSMRCPVLAATTAQIKFQLRRWVTLAQSLSLNQINLMHREVIVKIK